MQPKYFHLNLNNFKYHKYWTWQFVLIRLVCSVLMILLQVHGMYPVWLSWAFLLIFYVSVSVAFSNVFAFYPAFIKDFALHMPIAKIFCVNGIVFICFCQVISNLRTTSISSFNSWSLFMFLIFV